jgi:hypothetical protein
LRRLNPNAIILTGPRTTGISLIQQLKVPLKRITDILLISVIKRKNKKS